MVYLCGTKFDLVEENKKMRKVEFSVVKNYADGKNYQHNCTQFSKSSFAEGVLGRAGFNLVIPSTVLCHFVSSCALGF